jgi:hypothetical protein
MFRIFTMIFAAVISTFSGMAAYSQQSMPSQQGVHVISKFDIPGSPVTVSGLRVEGRSVAFCQQFEASDRWMDDTSVTVRNTSGKVITALSVVIYFRTSAADHLADTTLYFKGTLNPGEAAELQSRKFFDTLTQHLADTGVTLDTSHAQLRVEHADYSNDIEWIQGSIYRKDPLAGRRELVSSPLRVPNAFKWESDCVNVRAGRSDRQQPRVTKVLLQNPDPNECGNQTARTYTCLGNGCGSRTI